MDAPLASSAPRPSPARRGQLNFASSGSTPHLTMELFKMEAEIDIVHVPYKGTPAAVTELIGGQVSMMFACKRAPGAGAASAQAAGSGPRRNGSQEKTEGCDDQSSQRTTR
jgi:hypothetical protein